MEDESCKEKEKSNGNRQVTLETFLDKQKPYSIDNPRSKLLSHRIAEMMAVDLQPFSIVDDPGFCRLMKTYNDIGIGNVNGIITTNIGMQVSD